MKKMRAKTLAALVFIIPGIAAFLIFNIYPIVYSIFISFTDASLKNFPIGSPSIVGLENYKWVLSDPAFKKAFIWTWVFVLTSVSLKVFVGLILSILYTNKYVLGKTVFRALLIIPWALPLLFSVTIWKFMFDPVFGPVNIILSNYLGVVHPPRWTDQFTWGFIALNVIEVWLAYPFMMTVITSALQSVSSDLIEASIVDGATYWQRLRYIIIPLVSKPIMFATILTSAASFQYFLVPFIYNAGLFEDRFLLLYGYRKAFGASMPHYGRASAAMVITTLIIALYMYIVMRASKLQRGVSE